MWPLHRLVIAPLVVALALASCNRRDVPVREPANTPGAAAPEPAPGSLEAGAIGELRAVVSAQITFAATCANFGYAQQFEDLVKPGPGSPTGYLLPGLTNGAVKNGYAFTLRPGSGATVVTRSANTCNGAARDAMSSFFAEAHPVTVSMFSRRSFAVDERGTIYVRDDGRPIEPGMAEAHELK